MSDLDELTKAIQSMSAGFKELNAKLDQRVVEREVNREEESKGSVLETVLRWGSLILVPLFISYQTTNVQTAEIRGDIKAVTKECAENTASKLSKSIFYQVWNQHIANSTYNWKIIDDQNPNIHLIYEEKQ